MKNISFLLIVVWLSQVKGWSQPIIKRVQGNLSQSSVTKIIQDDLGFIWVGTRHGLNRYKGHEFDVFQPDDGEGASLSTSNITTLAKDKYGNIWIGTVDGGINFYDFKTGTFQAHRHDPDNENSPAEDLIMSMYADTLGYLYIGYQGGGMDVLDIQQQKYQHFKHDPQNVFSLPDNHIHSIEADEHGNLWVATNDAGIARFDYQGKKFYPYHLFDNQGNRIRTIRALHAKGNLLLAGTNNGIYKYNYLEHKFEQFATDDLINQNPVLSILIDSDEKILVGTENFGLFLIDQKKNEVVNLMERNSIWCIFQDKSQITWIGSYKNGLHKIDPFENYFENYRHEELAENSLSYNIVSSFIEDESGNLWVGTDGGGLNFLDLKKDNQYKLWTDENREQQYISSKAILDLLYDDDQNLYVATWKGGVNVLEHGKSKFSIINEENGLLGNNTYDFIKDQNGLIWILSFVEGLSIYNPKNKKFDYIRSQELGSSALRTIIEDFNHNFWIGTEGQGLIKIKVDSLNNIIEKKSFTNNNKQQIISNNLITYVYQCSDSIIWVGTEGGGLNKYNKENNSFITYTESDGLASNLIYGIIEDDLGYIWISTLKGLSRFDKNNNTFKNYRVSNNNGSVEFFKGACYKLKNGELLFGSIEGYYKFNPKDIVNNLTIPKVYITSIQVNGENISEKYSRNASLIDQLDLDYSENDIDLSYSALSYSEPEKTQFEYKMVGYDKEWSKVTNRHEVNYTNLPPGAYRFIIKASNNDDLWNKEGANLIINISEPWWNTLWAYIGYFLLIIAAIWYGRQLIIYREKLKNDLKIEHLELMKMQEVDELKSKFFTNISHEFRTPLTLLLGPLKVLMESEQNKNASKHYHTMHRNANKLLRLINEILELSKLESGSTKVQFVNSDIVDFIKPIALSFTEMAERKYIDYQCSFPDNPAHIYFDKTKVEKVILNVLSNAFKNTAEFGKIRFQLADSSHEIFIEIEDSGKGIPPEHLNHIFDRFYQGSSARGTN